MPKDLNKKNQHWEKEWAKIPQQCMNGLNQAGNYFKILLLKAKSFPHLFFYFCFIRVKYSRQWQRGEEKLYDIVLVRLYLSTTVIRTTTFRSVSLCSHGKKETGLKKGVLSFRYCFTVSVN